MSHYTLDVEPNMLNPKPLLHQKASSNPNMSLRSPWGTYIYIYIETGNGARLQSGAAYLKQLNGIIGKAITFTYSVPQMGFRHNRLQGAAKSEYERLEGSALTQDHALTWVLLSRV